MTNAAMIERAATRADQLAAMKDAPKTIAPMGNFIRYAKGPVGLNWIADNCEAQSGLQDRHDHAAMFRVVAKRIRRAIAA